MYELIKKFRPYFFSLRETSKDLVTLDLKIPITWKYDFLVGLKENVGFVEQDKSSKSLLLSIITENNEEGYQIIFEFGEKIINTNREFEEKEKLLKLKIDELKQLFNQESLEKLKEIEFLTHGQEDSTRDDVAE